MREQFEKLPAIKAILKKGVFDYTDFTKSYNFIDAMTCINARPSQHKDHGYLNGAWRTYQEQQKKIDSAKKEINDFFDNQTMTPSPREYANKLADLLEILK